MDSGDPGDALSELRDWVRTELAPWRFFRHGSRSLHQLLSPAIDRDPSVFRFMIAEGIVEFSKKDVSIFSGPDEHDALLKRCIMYKQFLQSVVDVFHITGTAEMAIDLDDLSDHSSSCPVLCFQKTISSHRILIPDVDFVDRDFYLIGSSNDHVDYDDKIDGAIFVGSTTGMLNINREIVEGLTHQRIRSAMYFRNDPDIRFELPGIVQCDGPETETLIRSLNLGSVMHSWRDQFVYRYLISVDGNGATCSRVAISLQSNGVLMKYDSFNELYYFKGLDAWKHYIPVNKDQDMAASLDLVRANPELPRSIARESRTFYRTRLSRIAIMTYTAELLKGYINTFGEDHPVSASSQEFAIDSFAHLSNQGDLWSRPGGWLEAAAGGWIEGIGLVNGPGVVLSDLSYRTLDKDGCYSDYCHAWDLSGSRGGGRPIIGFEITLGKSAARHLDLRYEARFLDGTHSAPVSSGVTCISETRAPLVALRVITDRRDGDGPI